MCVSVSVCASHHKAASQRNVFFVLKNEEMEEEEKINKPVDKYDRGFSSSLKFQTHEKCFGEKRPLTVNKLRLQVRISGRIAPLPQLRTLIELLRAIVTI